MIYLIESSGFKEGDNGEVEYFKLLKIGYTEESRKKLRYSAYKLHNPTIKVLYEIPNCTEDDEKRVLYKFRNLKFKGYGLEWFYYSEDIINFFKSIKDSSELHDLPKGISDDIEYSIYKKIVKEVVKYSYPFPNYQDINNCDVINYYNNLLENLGDNIKDLNKVYEYIKKDFGENSIDSYLRAKEARETGIYSEDEGLNTKIKKFFNEYNSVTTKDSRFKLLCENDLPKDCLDIILTFLPNWDVIKSYYITLGPEKIKRCYYNVTVMKKLINIKTFDINSLNDDIYLEFKKGDRIPLFEIKDKLDKIYKKFNYKATAKASDLKNYFEVREMITIVNINGEKKKGRCYELLKRKGE